MSKAISKTMTFSDDLHKKIENYPCGYEKKKMNPKVNEMLKHLMDLYLKTKIELRGFFNKQEAEFLTFCLVEIDVNTSISSKAFLLERVTETFVLNRYHLDLGVEEDSFKEKIKTLTEFQAYTVISMVCEHSFMGLPIEQVFLI